MAKTNVFTRLEAENSRSTASTQWVCIGGPHAGRIAVWHGPYIVWADNVDWFPEAHELFVARR